MAPGASLTDPGSPLSGSVTLSATASDGGGIAGVVFERSPAGADAWTTICTDTAAPYTCAFDTTAVGDESYDIRARATDNGGRSGTALVGSRVVDNDRLDFLDPTGATRLDLVRTATDLQLGGNFVTAATLFHATMTRSGSSVTITLGSFISGTLATSSGNGTMSWRPSAGALDLAGHPTGTSAVTETGAADRDF